MIKKSQYEMFMRCARELWFGKNIKSAFDDIYISAFEKYEEAHKSNKHIIEQKKRFRL